MTRSRTARFLTGSVLLAVGSFALYLWCLIHQRFSSRLIPVYAGHIYEKADFHLGTALGGSALAFAEEDVGTRRRRMTVVETATGAAHALDLSHRSPLWGAANLGGLSPMLGAVRDSGGRWTVEKLESDGHLEAGATPLTWTSGNEEECPSLIEC